MHKCSWITTNIFLRNTNKCFFMFPIFYFTYIHFYANTSSKQLKILLKICGRCFIKYFKDIRVAYNWSEKTISTFFKHCVLYFFILIKTIRNKIKLILKRKYHIPKNQKYQCDTSDVFTIFRNLFEKNTFRSFPLKITRIYTYVIWTRNWKYILL